MSDVPVPRNNSQVLGGMVARFCAKHGIPSLKVAGPVLSLFESAAQSDVRSVHDILETVDSQSLDDAVGPALDAWGAREDVPRQPLSQASGAVTLGDTSFTKQATAVFAGRAAPIVGSTTLYVIDASLFPASGSVYVSRGTSRYEGPIPYSAKANLGAYWSLTLSTPTLRFHNHGETVILAQGGDRTVAAGAIVRVPRSSVADPVDYRLVYARTVPDGETSLSGVLVQAVQPGAKGNVPAGAVRDFASTPYTGATVTNPIRYTDGNDVENDDDYRERVRAVRATRAKGVPTALEAAAVGAVSTDEGRRVQTARYVARKGAPSVLIIDDGTGYEETVGGVAVERVLEAAAGGELDLAVQGTPVAKAHVRTSTPAPFRVLPGAQLAVQVGGQTYVHTFDADAFQDLNAATAYEVVASINSNSAIGFSARTFGGGGGFAVYARVEQDDDVAVVAPDAGLDANDTFGFPAGGARTLALYRNDRVLSKDGRVAQLRSEPFGTWNTLAGAQTLVLSVDGTPAVTYTFVDADFVSATTGFLAVGRNSLAAWQKVLSARLPGVTVTQDGTRLKLTSNRGPSATAALAITGGTLVTGRVFTAASAAGTARDFILDRARGLVRLSAAATAGDVFSAGTEAPRAFLESTVLAPSTLAAAAHAWLAPDGDGVLVSHGVTASTPMGVLAHGVHDWGTRIRLEAFPGATPTAGVFSAVQAGDWAVLWDAAFPASVRGAWRVAEVGLASGLATRLILERRSARAARAGHASCALVPVGSNASRVLVCGGWLAPGATASTPTTVTNTVELYDPSTKTWTAAAPMSTARAYHTATCMNDGRVLVVGGVDASGTVLASAELYTPGTNTWAAATSYQVATAYHAAVKLATGKVLVAGGRSGSTYRTQTAVFDPSGDTWSANTALGTARAGFPLVLLPSGNVLAVGGETAAATGTTACETFTPGSPGTWAAAGAMPSARRNHGAALVSTTTVIAAGDDRAGAATGTYAVYTIGSNTWASAVALPSSAVFENKSLVTLQDGTVLALFGRQGTTPWSGGWNGSAWTTLTAPLYADAPARDEVAVVLLYNNAATLLNTVMTVGGLDQTRVQPTAAAEQFDRTANTWSTPDDAVVASLTLNQVGLSIARTPRWMQSLTIPAASSYTADSFAAALAGARGATFESRATSRLRLRTNSFDETGDVLLAATDTTALGLAAGAQANLIQPFASVRTASGLGTTDFALGRVLEEGAPPANVASLIRVNRLDVTTGTEFVLGRAPVMGTPASPHRRYGRQAGFRSATTTLSAEPQATLVGLRATPDGGLGPFDWFWSAAPFALGPQDDLTVVVDDDAVTKRFTVPLFRRVTPVGSTYATQITVKDADNGAATLATSFGTGFSFDDFAVYMQARNLLYSTTANKTLLARYYLHGPAGERVRVRVSYPLAAGAVAAVTLDAVTNPTVDVRLLLPGGSARALTGIRNSTRVGTACTAVSTGLGTVVYVVNLPVATAARDGANETTLTLTLPSGVTDHGFVVGDILFLQSSDGNWLPGNVTVTARTATTVKFTNTALGTGVASASNIGTVSADPQGEATLQGAGLVADDFLRVSASSGLAAGFTGETFRITGAAAGNVTAVASEKTFGATTATLVWASLGAASYLTAWASAAPTASAFATSINALAAAENSTCPVTLTITGTGSGTLTRSTVEDAADSTAWVSLLDGLNHVGRTVLPGTVNDDHQLVLKTAVSAGLATGTLWSTEDVRLVPVSAAALARWMQAPASSGLTTAAEVALVADGERVQVATLTPGSAGSVQVQGGQANAASAIVVGETVVVGAECSCRVSRADAAGLVAGTWVEARNGFQAPRLGVFTSSSVLSSWTATGYLTFSSTTLWTQRFLNSNVRLHVERHGRYVRLADSPGTNADGAVSLAGLVEGDYVELAAAGTPTSFAQVSAANLGIFRVVRVQSPGLGNGVGGAVWVENPIAVDETAELTLRGIAYDSVLPGDTIQVSHDLWNAGNRGTWTVEAVGVTAGTTGPNFANTTVLKVSVTTRPPVAVGSAAPVLDGSAGLVTVVEGAVGHLVKKIRCVSPDPADGRYVQVRLDTSAGSRLIGGALGTVLSAPDKLGLPTARTVGVDGYQVSTGLVGEVNRRLQGDPTDRVTYPGVAAAGTETLTQAAVVRRMRISVLVRVASGAGTEDLTTQIQETVSATVNRAPRDIALSSIEGAIQQIQGVVAATVLSPAHTPTRDAIRVGADEKAFVLALADVSVSYVTD